MAAPIDPGDYGAHAPITSSGQNLRAQRLYKALDRAQVGLDAFSLQQALFAPYETIAQVQLGVVATDIASAASYVPVSTPNGLFVIQSGTGANGGPLMVPFDPADHAISGLTPKLRVVAATATNGTAPGISLTYALHALASTGGGGAAMTVTLGGAVAGSSVVRAAPAASSLFRDVGSDFTVPSAGVYAFGVSSSGALPANAVLGVTLQLQRRWV